MTVELRPLGVACNLKCQYCYQKSTRDSTTEATRPDLAAMLGALEREGGPFTLFGGEPLLLPLDGLERLWKWGYEKHGRNNIQTNGTLINEAHLRLFRRYRVHVGISVDGPDELNDARSCGTLDTTRRHTAATHAAIARLCDERLTPSLIVTLHRLNATPERLPRLQEWLTDLDQRGLRSVRLHLLEVEDQRVRAQLALTVAENLAALRSLARFEETLHAISFDTFREIKELMHGRDGSASCVWNACDPYTTRAVRGIEGLGQSSNCGRTNKDGVDYLKADQEGFERGVALFDTPQEEGGCQGCRFFVICKGQCPGTALDHDWRNRSEQCEVWRSLFRDFEEEMLDCGEIPISASPVRRRVEEILVTGWERGSYTTLEEALRLCAGERDEHGGKTTAFPPVATSSHGDVPHGDHHGDHTDG